MNERRMEERRDRVQTENRQGQDEDCKSPFTKEEWESVGEWYELILRMSLPRSGKLRAMLLQRM